MDLRAARLEFLLRGWRGHDSMTRSKEAGILRVLYFSIEFYRQWFLEYDSIVLGYDSINEDSTRCGDDSRDRDLVR